MEIISKREAHQQSSSILELFIFLQWDLIQKFSTTDDQGFNFAF